MWYHLTPVRMVIIYKSTNDKCWRRCREKEILKALLVHPLCKTVWSFLKKLKMEFPFDPVIPLLVICPKKSETSIRKNICTPMFIAAQFTIAKIWRHPKYPSVDEWIKKSVVHLHPGILCICERNLSFEMPWRDMERIRLSRISQLEKDKYHMILLLCGL